jgi:prepilin-type N-terminal cleavage/methylation domain-containing protein
MKSRAFTLVEITVVLLIAGIAAAAVTLKLSGPVSRVKLQDVVESFVQFYGSKRSYARQQGKPLRLEVEMSENRVVRWDVTNLEDEKKAGRPLVLPEGFRIEKFIIAAQDGPADATLLNFSRQGFCRSYAIKVADKFQSRWIFFVGLTGQTLEIDDEQKVNEIMELLSRPDAD